MSSYERIDIDFWPSRLASMRPEISQLRALLAGLTRPTLCGVVGIAVVCYEIARIVVFVHGFRSRATEICRSHYIDHGASIHSKGLTAGPLLRAL